MNKRVDSWFSLTAPRCNSDLLPPSSVARPQGPAGWLASRPWAGTHAIPSPGMATLTPTPIINHSLPDPPSPPRLTSRPASRKPPPVAPDPVHARKPRSVLEFSRRIVCAWEGKYIT